jgi:tetratricopeptide (TPR) repeat protein
VACGEEPGLPFADGFFSLIYAISVFTHLTDHATGWLLELHRTMADGGLLMLTFLGEGMIDLINEPWEEDRIGFNPTQHGTSWDLGGPVTFISPWWIREHWGRAFEIVELRPHTSLQEGKPTGHGLALLRKRHGHFSAADIDAPAPNEPREARALQHNVRQLSGELIQLRQKLAKQIAEMARHAEAEAKAHAEQSAAFIWAQQQAADRDTTIERMQGEAAERDATIEGTRGEAAERDATIERMRGEIESLIARPPGATLVGAPGINSFRLGSRRKPVALADRAHEAREWDVAAYYYRIALERNPNRPEIWVQYGHVLKEADRLSSAEHAYRQAIAGAPTLAEPYRFLGDVLSAQGRRDDAVIAYRQAHSLDPNWPMPPSGLKGLDA